MTAGATTPGEPSQGDSAPSVPAPSEGRSPEFDLLIVEPDTRHAEALSEFLRPHGFSAQHVQRGDEAPARVLESRPHVVLLELRLPGMSGTEVCRAVRPAFTGALVVLTSIQGEREQIACFEAGADDYIEKPVNPTVLLARLRALLRPRRRGGRFLVAELMVDEFYRRATLRGEPLALSDTEFQLLLHLVRHRGRTVKRAELLHALRGASSSGRSLDLSISRLRAKLGRDTVSLSAVRGEGYVLSAVVNDAVQPSPTNERG